MPLNGFIMAHSKRGRVAEGQEQTKDNEAFTTACHSVKVP